MISLYVLLLCDKVSDKVSGNTRLTLCTKKKYYSIYHKLVRSDYGTLSFFWHNTIELRPLGLSS